MFMSVKLRMSTMCNYYEDIADAMPELRPERPTHILVTTVLISFHHRSKESVEVVESML